MLTDGSSHARRRHCFPPCRHRLPSPPPSPSPLPLPLPLLLALPLATTEQRCERSGGSTLSPTRLLTRPAARPPGHNYAARTRAQHHSLPTLDESGLERFKTLVFDEVKKDGAAAMLAVVNREREGEEIDRSLLRACVEVFEAMGMGTLDTYNQVRRRRRRQRRSLPGAARALALRRACSRSCV